MKTTILVNSLKELKTVADFYGIEVKSSELVVSFPYRLEAPDELWLGTPISKQMTFDNVQAIPPSDKEVAKDRT